MKKIVNALADNPAIFIWLRRLLENNFCQHKKIIESYFPAGMNERIIDIGCGTGEFSVFFNSDTYYGVDIEQKYITYARRHRKGVFITCDATHIPFPDGSFDNAIIIGVLHHLEDRLCHNILRELKRILKIKGQILIMEDVASINNDLIAGALHNLDRGNYIRTAEEYSRLLETHFEIIEQFWVKSGVCPYQFFLLGNSNAPSR